MANCGVVDLILSFASFKANKELKKGDGAKRQRITGGTAGVVGHQRGRGSAAVCALVAFQALHASTCSAPFSQQPNACAASKLLAHVLPILQPVTLVPGLLLPACPCRHPQAGGCQRCWWPQLAALHAHPDRGRLGQVAGRGWPFGGGARPLRRLPSQVGRGRGSSRWRRLRDQLRAARPRGPAILSLIPRCAPAP